MNKRGLAFVTGANGFVGANLARALLESGRQIRVLVRPNSDRRSLPQHSGVHIVEGDLRDFRSLQKAVKDCGEIFHVAADYRFWSLHPEELYQNNVEGTENLLKAALETGVERFVHTSTVGTIGLAPQPSPCHEHSPSSPRQFNNHYKRSKFQAEKTALDYVKKGVPVVVVNPSTPIGPWDRKPTPTGKIIVDFVQGKIPAYVKTGLNFVHVRDVAMGHILASEKGKIGERYILGNQNFSMKEFLELLSSLTHRKAPRIRIPFSVAWMAGYLSTTYANHISKTTPAIPLEAVKMSKNFMFFDSSKAIRELGLPQTSVQFAAIEALEWFLKNNYFDSKVNTFRESAESTVSFNSKS